MVKIILVQVTDNALGADGYVPGFQTDYTRSMERDNSTEVTKMGSISAIGALTETMELSMFAKRNDTGQSEIERAIEEGKEVKLWEVETEKNDAGTNDARFAFAVVDSHEVSSPAEGLEEISASFTVQLQSVRGVLEDIPQSLIDFARYGFQEPGETTGPHDNFTTTPVGP